MILDNFIVDARAARESLPAVRFRFSGRTPSKRESVVVMDGSWVTVVGMVVGMLFLAWLIDLFTGE